MTQSAFREASRFARLKKRAPRPPGHRRPHELRPAHARSVPLLSRERILRARRKLLVGSALLTGGVSKPSVFYLAAGLKGVMLLVALGARCLELGGVVDPDRAGELLGVVGSVRGGQALGVATDGRSMAYPGVRDSENRQLSNFFNSLGYAAGTELDDFGTEGSTRIARGPLSELWS